MAFDTEDTNTIVTLHSSGGQRLLQTERLLIQTGGWTTWWNKEKSSKSNEERECERRKQTRENQKDNVKVGVFCEKV